LCRQSTICRCCIRRQFTVFYQIDGAMLLCPAFDRSHKASRYNRRMSSNAVDFCRPTKPPAAGDPAGARSVRSVWRRPGHSSPRRKMKNDWTRHPFISPEAHYQFAGWPTEDPCMRLCPSSAATRDHAWIGRGARPVPAWPRPGSLGESYPVSTERATRSHDEAMASVIRRRGAAPANSTAK